MPLPMPIQQVIGGATPAQITVKLINRTAAALSEGDVVALNLDFAATAGQAMVGLFPQTIDTDSASGYILGAAIVPTAENVLRGCAVAVGPNGPGSGTIADNAYGVFAISGIWKVKMNTTNGYILSNNNNDGTIASPANSLIGYQNQTALDAVSKPISIVGIALETTTTVGKALLDAGILPRIFGGGA